MSTGERQRQLARELQSLLAQYTRFLSPGEMHVAVRLAHATLLEGECIVCGTTLKLYCPKCQGDHP